MKSKFKQIAKYILGLPILKKNSRPKLSKREIIHDNPENVKVAAFISIPKNASKSFLEILELGKNRDIENTTSLVVYENHQRAAVLKKKYDLNNLFVFCFSRNPYDRCVSWYEYHKHLEPYKSLTFESWVNQGMPHHLKVQNGTDYIAEGISPLLQYNYIDGHKPDFIGKIENLSSDLEQVIEQLNTLCEKHQLTHRFKLSNIQVNTSDRKSDYRSYYTEKSMKAVYSLLRKDFEHFGYEK